MSSLSPTSNRVLMVDVYARLCAITNKHSIPMPTNITQPQPVAFAKMQEQFVHWLSNGTISVFLASQNFITTHTKKKTQQRIIYVLLLKRIENSKFYIVFSCKQYGKTRTKANRKNGGTKDANCVSLELYIRMKKANLKSNCQPMQYNGCSSSNPFVLIVSFFFCLFILGEAGYIVRTTSTIMSLTQNKYNTETK